MDILLLVQFKETLKITAAQYNFSLNEFRIEHNYASRNLLKSAIVEESASYG
jgi:hypothetical protein